MVLSLKAVLARLAALGLAAAVDQVLPVGDLGADEAPLDVGVDLARLLGGREVAPDGPGAALALPGGEEGDEVDELVGLLSGMLNLPNVGPEPPLVRLGFHLPSEACPRADGSGRRRCPYRWRYSSSN